LTVGSELIVANAGQLGRAEASGVTLSVLRRAPLAASALRAPGLAEGPVIGLIFFSGACGMLARAQSLKEAT
jgi:hypothetical protein